MPPVQYTVQHPLVRIKALQHVRCLLDHYSWMAIDMGGEGFTGLVALPDVRQHHTHGGQIEPVGCFKIGMLR